MKVQDITCPSCGASLAIPEAEGSQLVVCSYCGKGVWLSDDVQRVDAKINMSVNNAEEAGYLFEKGRITAQQEENDRQLSEMQEEQKVRQKKKLWQWGIKILAWVLFFPIMLGWTVLKSKRFSLIQKLVLCGLIILVTIVLTSGGSHGV